MNKEILKKLASVANDLDQKGATKLANEITDIMLKVAQLPALPAALDEIQARKDVYDLEKRYRQIQDEYSVGSNAPPTEQNTREKFYKFFGLINEARKLSSNNPRDPRSEWADSKLPYVNTLRAQLGTLKDKMPNERLYANNLQYVDFLEYLLQKNIGERMGVVYDTIYGKYNKKVANDLAAALKTLGYTGKRDELVIKEKTFLTAGSKQRFLDYLKGLELRREYEKEKKLMEGSITFEENIADQTNKYKAK